MREAHARSHAREKAEPISLDDKYQLREGRVFLSGIQALVRLPLMQAALDRQRGLDTAGFVSGYRGSPLAGLDQQLQRAHAALGAHRVHFQPGLNEELAATAVQGSQQVGLYPGARYAGVFGLWYGKAPGVDRAADALRHANAAGTSAAGGVLLVAGDDHACKSSSYPTQSEFLLQHLEVPILAPADVQDVLDYGLLGWAMSRYSGCWVSLLALTDWMDGSAVVEVSPGRPDIVWPAGEAPADLHIRRGDTPLAQEERLRTRKLPAALAFARANRINRVVFEAPEARLVLLASGKAYTDTRQALVELGIDEAAAAAMGVRLVKIGMPWPVDPEQLRGFCAGADRVLVLEEKRPFLEPALRDALYGLPDGRRPAVLGKRDEAGQPLLAETGELDPPAIAHAIAARLPAGSAGEGIESYLSRQMADQAWHPVEPAEGQRRPFFCSGCPHNRSTRLPEGSRALVGIGCHYMAQWMERDTEQVCAMGGEGAAWIGQAPFTDEPHLFANLGDGTYAHSGILAIRAAVAAGVSITYKLLYNEAVAMTGGQAPEGAPSVAAITRQLHAEGVARIAVVAEDPSRHDPRELAPGVELEPRTRLDPVQRRLREVPGVSVLIYDQGCAAEKRRKRKRGTLPDPDLRVFINERVCEGCGDCHVTSNCLSVEPVETAWGLKRRIAQGSCNKDFSCLEGSCPAFVTVRGGRLRGSAGDEPWSEAERLPEPPVEAPGAVSNVLLAGIGGTGVTTTAALLGMAAHLEGRASTVLDMTGLAQKGGAVLSHVRIADEPEAIHGNRVPARGADLLLGADALVAASAAGLAALHPHRTRSVVHERVAPTADFVLHGELRWNGDDACDRIRRSSRDCAVVDAVAACERQLGDGVAANVFLLGLAFQRGWLPLQRKSLLRAIELNGVALETNRRAFELGRLAATRPLGREPGAGLPVESLDERIERCARELAAYQDEALAARYRRRIDALARAEERCLPGERRLTRAAADALHRATAVKDEYEVARLYSDGVFEQQLAACFEGDFEARFELAPPLFAGRDRETGRLRKRSFGPWMRHGFRALARLRWLRGRWLDPFRWLPERRDEAALRAELEAALDALAIGLDPDDHRVACETLEACAAVRGFDVVKAAPMASARRRLAALRERLLERGPEA